MKQFLRLGDCHALRKHRLNHLKTQYFSLLAVITSMCLEAQAQVAAATSAAPAALGKDTLDISRDTLQIEEVEINAGYYTVKDRERTGSIGRVDAQTIARQPVSNPLVPLHGQIVGMVFIFFHTQEQIINPCFNQKALAALLEAVASLRSFFKAAIMRRSDGMQNLGLSIW